MDYCSQSLAVWGGCWHRSQAVWGGCCLLDRYQLQALGGLGQLEGG